MIEIVLHGALERHGGPYRMACRTPRKAVRLLAGQLPELRRDIERGNFQVIADDLVRADPLQLEERTLDLKLPDGRQVHILPVVAGAGGRGGKAAIKIVAGVGLLATGVAGALGAFGAAAGFGGTAFALPFGLGAVTYGNLALMGASLLLTGVSSLLSPQPALNDVRNLDSQDKRESFYFNNGAVNLTEQGNPVPLAFGRCRIGSIPISAGLAVEQI